MYKIRIRLRHQPLVIRTKQKSRISVIVCIASTQKSPKYVGIKTQQQYDYHKFTDVISLSSITIEYSFSCNHLNIHQWVQISCPVVTILTHQHQGLQVIHQSIMSQLHLQKQSDPKQKFPLPHSIELTTRLHHKKSVKHHVKMQQT